MAPIEFTSRAWRTLEHEFGFTQPVAIFDQHQFTIERPHECVVMRYRGEVIRRKAGKAAKGKAK